MESIYNLILALLISRAPTHVVEKLYIPPITVYILVGFVLGPSLLNVISEDIGQSLITLSLLILLFYTGLNIDFRGAKAVLKESLILTASGVLTTLTLVIPTLVLRGYDPLAALVVGVSLANTATEVVIVALNYSRLPHEDVKRVLIISSFLDDLIAISFISVINYLALGSLTNVLSYVAKLSALSLAVVSATLIIMRRSSRLFRLMINPRHVISLSSLILFLTIYLGYLADGGLTFSAYLAGIAISMLRTVNDPTLIYVIRVGGVSYTPKCNT